VTQTDPEEQRAMARVHPAAWAMYASEGRWLPAPHLLLIADKLLALERGEIKRLAISMPPRAGKSELISKYFPGWWLGRNPTHRAVLTSYGHTLTKRWARESRDIFDEKAEDVFGFTTSRAAMATDWPVFDAVDKRTGGGLFACGRGGSLTGRGANILICDDLLKDSTEANSAVVRDSAWEWFTSVALTRLEPGGCCIVLATRWHHDDPIGRIEEMNAQEDCGEPWTILNLPAICDSEDDHLGRKVGEALWPERFDVVELEKTRQAVGSKVWNALYQGKPTPDGGALFKRDHFRYWDHSGDHAIHDGESHDLKNARWFGVADLAVSTKRRSDYSAFGVFAATKRALYVVDVRRGRLEAQAILDVMHDLVETYELSALFVEQAPSSTQLCQLARGQGIPIKGIKADKDKVTRALPATALYENHRIFHLRGAPWLHALEGELLRFPNAKHDDQADVISYGVRVYMATLRGGQGRGSRGLRVGGRL